PAGANAQAKAQANVDAGLADANVEAKAAAGLAGANVERDLNVGRPKEFRPSHLPDHLAGAPHWKHDRDIPWAVEARAWEALDSG
ncbi:MAG: hypothetical protein MUO50_09495, partial [Longimicrobiales bacterium]|nr:hypothetical protein [Longimicrobiales bacterium]